MSKYYPSSKLSATEYVAGVSAEGTELTDEEAAPLLEAGLIVKSKPAAKAAPKPRKAKKPAPRPAQPAEPAPEPEE